MILSALVAVLLVAVVLGACRWRRSSRVLYALALLAFLLAGCGVVPRWLLGWLQGPYAMRPALDWAPSNAIVLLTSGAAPLPDGSIEPGIAAYGRIVQAATMYRDCARASHRCTVLVSGGDPSRYETPLAVAYAQVLRQLGVPSTDLRLESRSLTTWQNAQFSRPILAALGAQRIWLVTSGFHLRRSELYFAHFGIHATPVRADYVHAAIAPWPGISNLVLAELAVHEYAGIVRYRVYNLMGWNAPPAAPLSAPARGGVDQPERATP